MIHAFAFIILGVASWPLPILILEYSLSSNHDHFKSSKSCAFALWVGLLLWFGLLPQENYCEICPKLLKCPVTLIFFYVQTKITKILPLSVTPLQWSKVLKSMHWWSPCWINFDSFTFNFNKSFLKETVQQIKRCKAHSYSHWSFDPIHSQTLVNALPHPFCFIDIFCSAPHPTILWFCWSRYPIGLHSPANYFQWVGDRLAKESCTSTKKQSVKWI